MPLNIDYDALKSLSDAVEDAVDSLLNPFSATTPEQEKTIITAAESLWVALAEIDRLRAFESFVEERWS